MNKPYRLEIFESERGWGSKTEYEYFATAEEAAERKKEINSYNISTTAPDWYMVAKEITYITE